MRRDLIANVVLLGRDEKGAVVVVPAAPQTERGTSQLKAVMHGRSG
jgi:hypothetical protein